MQGRSFCIAMLFIFLLVAACQQTKPIQDLVKPEQWWSVHPRPVYQTLEKVGTYQEWFDVYKLTEGTFAIYEPNHFEEAICYLVLGQERAALIDTGTGIGDLKSLVGELTDLPIFVVLTHEHYDHVAAAFRFAEIVMYDNPAAIKVLRDGRDNASLRHYIEGDYLWKPLPEGFDPDAWNIPSMEPDLLLQEGDIINLGDRALEVIYTPGHSPGQMCLLDHKHRLLFTGDHFFPGPLYAYGPDVNISDYIDSNQKLCERIKDFDILCSGHNDPWIKSEVLLRVQQAFSAIMEGQGNYSESEGLRRYNFNGFDILIKTASIPPEK